MPTSACASVRALAIARPANTATISARMPTTGTSAA